MVLEEADLKDETEMEILLKNDPEQIERGLKVIANQVNTPKGRIDLLCIDADGVLTIIELKVTSDENQFKQGIRYFDWAIENIDWLRDAYKVPIADQKPRIILIAPEFDEDILTEAKYWKEYVSSVNIFRFKCLKVENKKHIICSEVLLQSPKEIQEKPKTINDHLSYIRDEKVKENCIKVMDIIKRFSDKDIEVFPKKWGIVFKYRGRNFAIIYPKRESFVIQWKSEDEEDKWPYITGIKKIEQANEIIEQQIKKAFSLVGGKNQ